MTPAPIAAVGFSLSSKDGSVADLEPGLRHFADLGADIVEIGAYSVDLIAGGRIIPERVEDLVRLTRSLPLAYTFHGLVTSNFMDPETLGRQVAVAKAMLELCDRIGAGVLVQHSGSLRADQQAERAAADQRELDALGELAGVAARYGVRVALENIFTVEPGEYRRSPSGVAAAVRRLDHPNVVALIDFSHAYIEATFRGLDFREELRAMAPVTGHLHVHDSFGRLSGPTRIYARPESVALGLGDLHLPLGWGDIPWRDIFADLAVLPGTTLIMEIEQTFRPEHPACLAEGRHLAGLANRRTATA